MDSSKNHLGGTEGCSSNESGWTMYISSPMDQDYDDVQCSYDVIENFHYPVAKDEQDSDDSMASDASSGPNKQETYHQDHGGKPASKSGGGNGKSFSLFSKSNKKEKKNDGNSNDKNSKRVSGNRRSPK